MLVGMLIVVCLTPASLFSQEIFSNGFESGMRCWWSGWVGSNGNACEQEISVTLPGDVTMVLVRIPAGTFMMGSPATERARYSDREDLHQVTLTTDYYLGEYEVTQEQWEALGFTNPSGFSGCGGTCPVESVNWFNAVIFANAVSLNEGLQECYVLSDCNGSPGDDLLECTSVTIVTGCTGYRLPTDAEWERAARAGTQTRYSFGDALECGDQDEACATYDPHMLYTGNGTGTPEPVGSRLANGYGLYNMHGNVREWAQDWYEGHLGSTPVTDPQGPETGTDRVRRAGSWNSYAKFCRSSYRAWDYPAFPYDYLGFRLARTTPKP